MLGQQPRVESLFYYFRLEDHIPEGHLLRLLDHQLSWFAHSGIPSVLNGSRNRVPGRNRKFAKGRPDDEECYLDVYDCFSFGLRRRAGWAKR